MREKTLQASSVTSSATLLLSSSTLALSTRVSLDLFAHRFDDAAERLICDDTADRMELILIGELQSVDGYMNIALEKTAEYVNGQKRREYGDAFVRGNNGECRFVMGRYLANRS